MKHWIKSHAHDYTRKGSRTYRRTVVKRMIEIANDIKDHEKGVHLPNQIGRAHIHRYYARQAHLSDRTLQDHYYVIRHLWALTGRTTLPPKPPAMKKTNTRNK